MIEKLPLTALKDSSEIDLFVCVASFEERCLSIAKMTVGHIKQAVIIRNHDSLLTSEGNYASLFALFRGRVTEASVSTNAPTETADVFSKEVISRISETRKGGIVFVDITTFTHEQLLILIALLDRLSLNCELRFGYTGAAEYSTNTDEEGVWLSHGVRQVRSILGYPGNLAPSRRLHLIVLLGFESERARLLIEMMEPSKLSLGTGDAALSVSRHHFSRNERFASRLDLFLKTQDQIQTEIRRFSFSCINPYDARDAILRETADYSNFNTVICPMNTKISTVGAGLAALIDPRLQLIYAAPEEYNEEGYSTPGEDVTVFPVTFGK